MSEDLTPAQHAIAIDESRQRMCDFALRCTPEQWQSAPIEGDPRSVGVITDHVAHAYEYLAGWLADVIAGGSPEVNSQIVDELNAGHATTADALSQAEVADHLKTSGDVLINLVKDLEPAQLEVGDGRVRRFAVIAARHGDSHREEIEAALG